MSPTFTEDHPYVQAYLKRVAAAMLQAEDSAHELGSVSGCADPRWHQCTGHDQCSNWWRADYGGVAYPAGVADVLSPADAAKFSVYDLQRIFVVAALAVYARPKHPAHWAFWAKNARYRVAKEVQEVILEKHQRIVVPREAGWIDEEYNLICLRVYQKGWLPLTPRPAGEHHARAALPKKKAAVGKTRTSARRGRKFTAKAAAVAEPAEKNANGKRAAPVEEGEEVVGAPAPKRQKRAAVGAASAKKAEKAKGQSNVSEKRVTRASTATRAQTRAAAKSAEKAPSPLPTIHISPPTVVDVSEPMDVEEIAVPLTPTKAAAPPMQRTHSEESLDASFSPTPLSSPPSTPSRGASSSVPASPTPKRPAGRCLPVRAISEAKSDYSEMSLAPSATLTLVASSAASEDGSTRANTPLEVVVPKKSKTKAKAAPIQSPQTPVRISARIQAKKGDSSPETSDSSPLANRSWKKRRA